MSEMVLSTTGKGEDAASILNQFRIKDTELKLVRKFGVIIKPNLRAYVEEFYVWLTVQPYFKHFFADEIQVEKVKQLQVDYWHTFFDAKIDDDYTLPWRNG